MSRRTSFTLVLACALAGCAGPTLTQPVAIPFAAEAKSTPVVESRHALEALRSLPANKPIAEDLASLATAETDGRCRAFAEAGARAWTAGCRDAARELWGMALECRPTRSVCLPVGETHALLVHRPLDMGEAPALGTSGPAPAKPTASHFWAVELNPAGGAAPDRERDLTGLVQSLVPPAAADGCVVVRGAHALELVPQAALAARSAAIAEFARRQRGITISVEARWMRFPLGGEDTGGLFGAEEGLELDRLELERLRIEHGGEILSAPRLSMFPGQAAHIAIVRTLSYVADFELSGTPAGDFIADPVIGTAVAGQTVEVCAAVVEKGAVALRIAPASCEVGEPIPELHLALPGVGHSIVVQVPRAARYALSRVVTIPEGRTRWIPVGWSCDAAGKRFGIGLAIDASVVPLEPVKPKVIPPVKAPVAPPAKPAVVPPAKPEGTAPPKK